MAQRIGTRGGVERQGFGMVRRSAGVPSINTVAAPDAAAASAASATWGTLARTLSGISTQEHALYDRQVAVAAKEQGVEDAISGNVRTLDRSTTRGGAYMDAAVGTMKMIMETNAIVALGDLARENASNPAGLQEAVDLYSEGALGDLMKVDPEAAVSLRTRIVTHAIPMVNGAIANREEKVAEAVKAARGRAEQEETAIVASHAEHIFPEPGDEEMGRAAVAGLLDAHGKANDLRAVEGAEAFLLSRLSSHHSDAHIINMQPELKTRLAAMIDAAPEEISAGLGIYSGYRTKERQRELWEASDKSGRRVARPGGSMHNHGNAADLSWNGKSLSDDAVPDSVRKWVHENAADYGLKFPLVNDPKERHHVEIQETRGGERWQGNVGVSRETVFGSWDQDFYDNTIGAGFKSWFQRQTNKQQAYLDFINGDTVLPMQMPDGTTLTVNVRGRLSEPAVSALEQDLRSRMVFDRQIIEAAEADAKDEADRRSGETRATAMAGILFNGREMTVDGRTVKAVMPTPGDLVDWLAKGDLDPTDFEALSKAITVDRPDKSDETVLREAYRLVVAGENPERVLMENLDRISTADAERLTGYHRTRQNDDGALSPLQKDYLDDLDRLFVQGQGPGDKYDTGKQERRAAALQEARERMLAGEPPKAVFDEIAERATVRTGFNMGVSPPVPRPRFFVADPADPLQIDGAASLAALEKALTTRELSGAEFDRNLRFLDEFLAWQDQRAAMGAAP